VPTAQRDFLLGIFCLGGFGFLCWFLAVAVGSTAGEAAAALGGVIGGAIGAGGAGYSVYYSLTRQKQDEAEKATYAVLAELAVMTKYFVGHLGFCEMIKTGFQFPRSQLNTVLITPEPIIYKSISDKILYLPRSIQIIEFYTRIGEMIGIISLIMNSPNKSEFILPDEIRGMADLFIAQCQVLEAILTYAATDPKSESVLAEGLRTHILTMLRQQLEQAKEFFPDSEAFQ
jgi:hypothetical protein